MEMHKVFDIMTVLWFKQIDDLVRKSHINENIVIISIYCMFLLFNAQNPTFLSKCISRLSKSVIKLRLSIESRQFL